MFIPNPRSLLVPAVTALAVAAALAAAAQTWRLHSAQEDVAELRLEIKSMEANALSDEITRREVARVAVNQLTQQNEGVDRETQKRLVRADVVVRTVADAAERLRQYRPTEAGACVGAPTAAASSPDRQEAIERLVRVRDEAVAMVAECHRLGTALSVQVQGFHDLNPSTKE